MPVQEAAGTVAELPPIIAGPVATARSYLKYVKVDSEAGTVVIGNRDPVSALEIVATFAGMSGMIAAPSPLALVDAADDVVPRLGGRYKDLDAQGGLYQRHHMPADSVNGLSRGQGPAILMDPVDHMRTASWGPAGAQHRALQQQLIEQGRFDDAIVMDIDDILMKFGDKYDEHILQMIDSLDN